MQNFNVWDNTVPVEKSSYVNDDSVHYYNVDSFKSNQNDLNMVDLFCGAGGFSVGAKWAGYHAVFGNDHFEPAIKTWTANHPDAISCLGDIRKIDPVSVKNLLESKGIKNIHLLTGGVPCQGFSRANRKHNDDDERNFLFLEYMRFVEVLKPDAIILENVSGMRSSAGGKFEKEIKAFMESLGYNVEIKLVNAADYGVPQIRQRLIFVGINKAKFKNVRFTFPAPTVSRYVTVEEAWSDLPKLNNNQEKTKYRSAPLNDYQKLMRGEGQITEIAPPKALFNHRAPNHPASTILNIKNTKQGEPMYKRFKQRIRLRLDTPSPTQLAGGIRPSFQFGHPTEPRGLSIRERARIQSFPDSYKFIGGIVQERVQTGNAVPPLLAYNIIKQISKILYHK